MEAHLVEISSYSGAGARAVLVLDSTAWRTSPRLRPLETTGLAPAVSYSPGLDSADLIRALRLGNRLSRHVWNRGMAVVDACCMPGRR